jgi:hypothetical protein
MFNEKIHVVNPMISQAYSRQGIKKAKRALNHTWVTYNRKYTTQNVRLQVIFLYHLLTQKYEPHLFIYFWTQL